MEGPREAGDGEESPSDPATSWKPNEDFLKVLTGMGLSRNAATKGLFYTGNKSADLAAAWIFENQDANLEVPLSNDDLEEEEEELGHKMVFVVNAELPMGVGKLAAQVAHAALGLNRLLARDEDTYGTMVLHWIEYGETKIVLRGENSQQMAELQQRADQLNLPNYLVHDAGKTQIPVGSATVLAIMGRSDIIDQVTGSLKLL